MVCMVIEQQYFLENLTTQITNHSKATHYANILQSAQKPMYLSSHKQTNYIMISLDSLIKSINDLFPWSSPQQSQNQHPNHPQNQQSLTYNLENQKTTKSQKNTSTKNDSNPETINQKPQEHKKTVISYIKDMLIEEEVLCQICMNKYRKPGVSKLCQCQHQYCKLCLKEYINSKLATFSLPKCPQQSCEAQIDKQSGFFKSLNPKTRQLFEKVEKFHFTSNDPFLKMCPSQNCQGIIPVIENHPFECIQCQKQFCKKCMYPKHDGKCIKNQAAILNMKYKYCKCNKCGIVVQKSQACDHMTCVCGYEFCYRCGRKWIGSHHCPQIKRIQGANGNGTGVEDNLVVRFVKMLGKLVATLAIVTFIPLYLAGSTLPMMISTLLIGLLAGITYYTFLFINKKYHEQSRVVWVVLIILLPLTMIYGVYIGFRQFWGRAFLSWWQFFILTFQNLFTAIWQ